MQIDARWSSRRNGPIRRESTLGNMIQNPSSVPARLVVELSRQKLLPDASGIADDWMMMLNSRREECEATLDREHMALELVFRRVDSDGEWLYWVTVRGGDGAGLDESLPIDRDHVAFARQAKLPGWQEASIQNLLCPPTVRDALIAAAKL